MMYDVWGYDKPRYLSKEKMGMGQFTAELLLPVMEFIW